MTLHVTAHPVGLVGRVPVEAAVWTLRVVEQDSPFNRRDHLLQAGKRPSVKEFVLDGIVDALGHRVVLRVTVLGHAWRNVIQPQLLYVFRAGVLGTAVGVVDEGVGKAFGQRGYGFFFSSRISAFNAFISSAWLSTGSFFISSALLSFSDAKVRIILHTTDCAVSYPLANSLWLTPSR